MPMSWIFRFDTSSTPPILTSMESTMVDLSEYSDSIVVQRIADAHLSLLETMKHEVAVRGDDMLPPETTLSSQRSRYQQTTVGSLFCQAIKEELETDVALLNGGSIKGNTIYEDNCMSYAQLKKELPFPTKMIKIEMTRSEVQDAIFYSRTSCRRECT